MNILENEIINENLDWYVKNYWRFDDDARKSFLQNIIKYASSISAIEAVSDLYKKREEKK